MKKVNRLERPVRRDTVWRKTKNSLEIWRPERRNCCNSITLRL